LPFRKQWEDSDVMLASTQETLLIQKVNSILIQAATSFWRKELLFHFSMSLYMQLFEKERCYKSPENQESMYLPPWWMAIKHFGSNQM
jgi:hypothetical protein